MVKKPPGRVCLGWGMLLQPCVCVGGNQIGCGVSPIHLVGLELLEGLISCNFWVLNVHTILGSLRILPLLQCVIMGC